MKYNTAMKAGQAIAARMHLRQDSWGLEFSAIIDKETAINEIAQAVEDILRNIPDGTDCIQAVQPDGKKIEVGMVNIAALRSALQKARRM